MHWYKMAISQEDFYKFYAYSGLTEEDLKENPVLLFEMIEHLNYIRNYYLEYLAEEISKELGNYCMSSIGNIPEEETEFEEFDVFLDNYELMSFSEKLIKAHHYFKDYRWSIPFGGKPWAKITEWTKKLNDIGEIPQQKYSPMLFSKIYKLIMIIDTIHSLEHNTSLVLRDLPEEEHKWLRLALEIARASTSIRDLATLSKDRGLLNHLYRRGFPGEDRSENLEDIYINSLQNFFESYLKEEDPNIAEEIVRRLRIIAVSSQDSSFEYFLKALYSFVRQNNNVKMIDIMEAILETHISYRKTIREQFSSFYLLFKAFDGMGMADRFVKHLLYYAKKYYSHGHSNKEIYYNPEILDYIRQEGYGELLNNFLKYITSEKESF